MSEEEFTVLEDSPTGYPGVQVGTFILGDQFVFRAPDGESFKKVVVSVAENAEDIVNALSSIKQAAVAKGIFTGDSSSAAKSSGSKGSGERAKDSPPPSGGSEVPTCAHGPRVDLRGRGYKKNWYCSLDTKNYKEKCPPID